MTRKKAIILAAIAVGVVAIVLANLKLTYEEAVRVEVAKVEKGPITEKVSGPGVVYAEASVSISSSVMGRITDLAVKEGQNVHKGEVLLKIDDSQYKAHLNQAEAAHKGALARMDLAKARLDDAEKELARVSALSQASLVSDRDSQSSKTAYAVAKADFDATRNASEEAKAGLVAAGDELDKTTIVAPISGTVTSLNVEQGEIAITGTMNNPGTVLMVISSLDTMEVRADIDETDVAKVRPGQRVEISVDAFADTLLAGVVSVVGSSSSSTKSYSTSSDQRATFEVRIRITDPVPGLRPGMATTVDIVTASKDSATYVPMQALVARDLGKAEPKKETEGVFTVEKSRSKFVPVRTGVSDDKNIEILGSLGQGSEVIVGPFKVLRDLADSTKVKVTQAKASKAKA
ncbi:MAG TPA: efflux RND transporter periplasmic adaptor subunit [bacterium]|nr:efflux RND transporter periplasmic adaptor subunit [bacterium]